MNVIKFAGCVALVAFSAGSFAARPTSIVFNSNAEASDGAPYAQYTVKCSNGKKVAMTAWDNRNKWCVGTSKSKECEKKQIEAAKAACKTPS